MRKSTTRAKLGEAVGSLDCGSEGDRGSGGEDPSRLRMWATKGLTMWTGVFTRRLRPLCAC
ncbi:hypothetical protein FH972_001623 [Carpinus fangiana]|uniref:Uncharacterized protein n=1 Tax=Carpinus fangiana TaxID=176857 RepID=A0A5N6QCP3_9ROSI|nr:hypothetical protein FH972_001623 [Carpinus fangiana]